MCATSETPALRKGASISLYLLEGERGRGTFTYDVNTEGGGAEKSSFLAD